MLNLKWAVALSLVFTANAVHADDQVMEQVVDQQAAAIFDSVNQAIPTPAETVTPVTVVDDQTVAPAGTAPAAQDLPVVPAMEQQPVAQAEKMVEVPAPVTLHEVVRCALEGMNQSDACYVFVEDLNGVYTHLRALVQEQHMDINVRDASGQSLLQLVAVTGNRDHMLETLVELGADVSEPGLIDLAKSQRNMITAQDFENIILAKVKAADVAPALTDAPAAVEPTAPQAAPEAPVAPAEQTPAPAAAAAPQAEAPAPAPEAPAAQ
jgi:hypothetical protein